MTESRAVSSASELAAAPESGALDIEIHGTIAGTPLITLGPGVTRRGATFRFGATGVRLTPDNTSVGVTVMTADDEIAVLNDTSVREFGTLTLRDVTTCGQVLLLAGCRHQRPYAQVIGKFIAQARSDPALDQESLTRFVEPRRDRSRAVLQRGVECGEIPTDTPTDVALELRYGALYRQMLHGHAPINHRFVASKVDLVLDAVAPRAGRAS